MKKKVFKSTVYIFILLLLTSFSAFAVPKHINYQGKLTDKSGNALDGDYQMKFSIFDSKTGGEEALWEEQQNVTVTEGIYSIQLGVNTPLPIDLFDNEGLYLEVSITSDGITYESLSPRQHLTSVPFAMESGNAKTLDGMTASDFISRGEDKAIEGNMIGDGAVGPTNLADNSVTSEKIADGTIRQTDLSFSLPDGHSLDTAGGDLVNALYVNNAGNVGIGTTDPHLKLDVRGIITTSDSMELTMMGSGNRHSYIDFHGDDTYQDYGLRIIRFGTGKDAESQIHHRGSGVLSLYTSEQDSHIVLYPIFGNVGIGMTTPRSKLDVNGNIHTYGKVLANAYSSNSPLIFEAPTGTERARIDEDTGNFGIGTTGPKEKLTVAGNLQATRVYAGPSSDEHVFFIQATDMGSQFHAPAATIGTEVRSSTDDITRFWMESNIDKVYLMRSIGSDLHIRTQNAPDYMGYHQMTITGDGDVGIGTQVPAARLDVYTESEEKGALIFRAASSGFSGSVPVTKSRLVVTKDGNVGIGTADPLAPLSVVGHEPGEGVTTIHGKTMHIWHHSDGHGGKIMFDTGESGGQIAILDGGQIAILDDEGSKINLNSYGNSYCIGNFGVGTIHVSEKLTVQGNILVKSESTGEDVLELGEGLDYAEGFDVTDEVNIESGMVLVIDPHHPGNLMLSQAPYDTKVAGIVGGAKGLGSGVRLGVGQFDYDVALAGRVYCNVDATEAGIEPGDLLTTSATPGYAMKVSDYRMAQGAILGKAMGRLEIGRKGQIMVLVTLQ